MVQFFEELPISMRFSKLEVLKEIKSVSQNVLLLNHPQLGKILVIDNEVQHVEAWSPIYHEPLVHLAFAMVREPVNILVLGGGSLYAVLEILKYRSAKRIVLVDHDPEVIKMMTEFYSHAKLIIKDERLEIIYCDIHEFLDKTKMKFDVIINDCSDSYEESLKVKNQLINKIHSKLTLLGVCSDMIYRNIYHSDLLERTSSYLRTKFAVFYSLLLIPEYPGIFHLLTIWGNNKNICQNFVVVNDEQLKWTADTNPCVYYNPSFINYYSYLPKYLKDIITPKT